MGMSTSNVDSKTMKKFRFLNLINYSEIHSDTDSISGERLYHAPGGSVPSVTTILSKLPSPELDAWRDRMGVEEADRIAAEAAKIGTYVHDMLESFVKNIKFNYDNSEYENIAKSIFHVISIMGLRHVNDIMGVEVPLYVSGLYAGRTDLVAKFNGIPSIIDYKTGLGFKGQAALNKYKLQIAAYAIAHEEMFGDDIFPIRQGVIIVGTRPNVKYNKNSQIQIIKIDENELYENKEKWLAILNNHYS